MDYLGLNISYLATKEHLSKDDFGRKFGLNRGTISSYINNDVKPKLETLQKISAKYNVLIDDLLNRDISNLLNVDYSHDKVDECLNCNKKQKLIEDLKSEVDSKVYINPSDFERLKKVIFWLINSGQVTSQEDLAHRLGNTEYLLSQITKGRRPLSIKFIKKLCTEFNELNPDYLLTEDAPMLLCNVPKELASGACLKCIEKDKRIEDLTREVKRGEEMIEVQGKLIRSLENETQPGKKEIAI